MRHFIVRLATALAFGLGLCAASVSALSTSTVDVPAAVAAGLVLYVASGGSDTANDCTVSASPCATIQHAVDQADSGAEIRVATGNYAGVSVRDGVTQTVYLSKTVTIRGGYTTANWSIPDLEANPVLLNAQGQGRVLFITGDISPTIEGLRITGGDTMAFSAYTGYGGGIYIITATATISANRVFGNNAPTGGGLYAAASQPRVEHNLITSNTARYGGGVYLYNSPATLDANRISANTAITSGGGALFLFSSPVLTDNLFISNSAVTGGGLLLASSDALMLNTVIADNYASASGSALYLDSIFGRDCLPLLIHTTIARNTGGDGSGIYATDDGMFGLSYAVMTNTIIVEHATGIVAAPGNGADLNGVLWFNNGANTGGAGIIAVTSDITGTPAFDTDGYHLTAGSAALNRGVDTGMSRDIDGESRPMGAAPDLGADELPIGLLVTKQVTPSVVPAGSPVTYTVRVTNTGAVSLTATISDLLPSQVVPTGILTWTPTITAPGGVWVQQFSVTVAVGYSGTLTNVVQVSSQEGASGVFTATSSATVMPSFIMSKWADPDPVEAGLPLTYTLVITNAGDAELHATVTDTLPGQVTPSGVITWTPLITAPGGVWIQQLVVTVVEGYSGTLTNTLHATTVEGVTGVYTLTSRAIAPYLVYLPVVLRASP